MEFMHTEIRDNVFVRQEIIELKAQKVSTLPTVTFHQFVTILCKHHPRLLGQTKSKVDIYLYTQQRV